MIDISKVVELAVQHARMELIEKSLKSLMLAAHEALAERWPEANGVKMLPGISLDADGNVRFVVLATDIATQTDATGGFNDSLVFAGLAANRTLNAKLAKAQS